MNCPKKQKVRKGLEAPLLISGVSVRNYYLLLICYGIVGIFLFCELNVVIDKLTLEALLYWAVKVLIGGVLLWFIRGRFIQFSNQKKYHFTNTESTISNRDIFHYLQKPTK